MRANEHDLGRAARALHRHLEVRRLDALREIALARDLVTEGRELTGDEAFGRVQSLRPADVALADLAGERLDVASETGLERGSQLFLSVLA